MPSEPRRIYAFDHLKTTLMFLVVIFHAGLTYIVTDLGIVWPFKDPYGTSLLFDVVVAFISGISMPLFFIVSGFMTCLLFTEQGLKQMFKNRLNRLFYPFLVFLLLLFPATEISYFTIHNVVSGVSSPFLSAVGKFYNDQFEWRFFRPIHLWFLYYLILFCICGSALATLLKRQSPKIAQKIQQTFLFVYSLKVAPLLFAIITFILLCMRKQNVIETPGVFSINFIVFISYAFFFAFGWMLYHQREYLARFKTGYILFFAIGFCFFITKLLIIDSKLWDEKSYIQYVLAALNAVFVWFMLFSLIGLFLKYFNKYSPLGRYLSDASYWIYLVHFPIVLFLQATFINVDLNVFAKFFLVISITFLTTALIYNYLVRNTFIGKFLNGKKYKRGMPN